MGLPFICPNGAVWIKSEGTNLKVLLTRLKIIHIRCFVLKERVLVLKTTFLTVVIEKEIWYQYL